MFKDFIQKRGSIVLCFSLAFATLAIAGYLIYREICRPKRNNTILFQYGYLFRNKTDIAELDKAIQAQGSIEVKVSDKIMNDSCTLSCVKPGQYYDVIRKNFSEVNLSDQPRYAAVKQAPSITYSRHGCCLSYQKHIEPVSLNIVRTGKEMRIVQFKNYKQLFLTDVCEQAQNCNRGCDCRQQNVTAMALVSDTKSSTVFDEDDNLVLVNARMELVTYPGWCKCFNRQL